MRMLYHVMSAPAPLGLLFLAANDQGLQVVEYMDRRSLKRTLADHTRPGAEWEASLHGLRPLADQMDEYFTGARRVFEWPLAPVSSPLQLLVMRAIRDTMVLAPPFVITREEVDEVVQLARRCFDLTARDLARGTP